VAGDWTDDEIAVAIETYFLMLSMEIEGVAYTKASIRRSALELLPRRSKGSVEFKWQNISAILDESGNPWIVGYKPASNYQERLKELTAVWLLDHPFLRSRMAAMES
jgi:hypothetical protein